MKNVKNEPKTNSGLPVAIIVLVLVAVVAGGWWFYSSSQATNRVNANRAASNANRSADLYRTAPAGAPLGVNVIGSPNAAVTVEEFADFQCGSCAAANPTMNEIKKIYGGNPNFRFIFRHFPLAIPAHDKAYEAAAATEAAGMQGKFWQMQNELFTNQQAWTGDPNYRQTWAGYAEKLGMDVPKFQADMVSIAAKSRVDADMQRGRALGVNSTPTIYLNGRPVPYPQMTVPGMRQLIDMELQKAQTGQQGTGPAAPASGNTAANQ